MRGWTVVKLVVDRCGLVRLGMAVFDMHHVHHSGPERLCEFVIMTGLHAERRACNQQCMALLSGYMDGGDERRQRPQQWTFSTGWG